MIIRTESSVAHLLFYRTEWTDGGYEMDTTP